MIQSDTSIEMRDFQIDVLPSNLKILVYKTKPWN